MDDFGRVINEGKNMVTAIIEMYRDKIEEAYHKGGGGNFSINLGLKLLPEGEDIRVESSIGFVEGRVKDSIEAVVSGQQELGFE